MKSFGISDRFTMNFMKGYENRKEAERAMFNLVANDDTIDWSDGRWPGCARIFDGEGKEHESVRWVNTKTGVLNKCVPNEKGDSWVDEYESLVTETITVPLPIRIEWEK